MRQLAGFALALLLLAGSVPHAQRPAGPEIRLVLLIAVDQFRYDYLTRFRSEYTGGLQAAADRRRGLHQRQSRALPDRHRGRSRDDAVGRDAVGERHHRQRLVRSRDRRKVESVSDHDGEAAGLADGVAGLARGGCW